MALKIETADLLLREEDGRHRGEIDVILGELTRDGKVRFQQTTLRMNFSVEQIAVAKAKGIPFTKTWRPVRIRSPSVSWYATGLLVSTALSTCRWRASSPPTLLRVTEDEPRRQFLSKYAGHAFHVLARTLEDSQQTRIVSDRPPHQIHGCLRQVS